MSDSAAAAPEPLSDDLLAEIVRAAAHVPETLLASGAVAVQATPGWSFEAQSRLMDAVPAPRYRSHAHDIAQAWSRSPEIAGATIASAIRAAAATGTTVRAEQTASLVWTGPSTDVADLRSTRAVLTKLVEDARESLTLVSFASHDVADLTAKLAATADGGVQVTMILETPDDPGEPLDFDSSHPFRPLRTKAGFYYWPADARQAFFAKSARLHAKCVIADRSAVLITSANLTSAGINDNLELGVLIENGPLPETLSRHLDALIGQGTLQPS